MEWRVGSAERLPKNLVVLNLCRVLYTFIKHLDFKLKSTEKLFKSIKR